MADLNDPNKPTVIDFYADVIDTLRENTKRVAAGAVPIGGGTVSGPISATSFTIMPGGYTVWHQGNFNPANYMPLAGGTFTGPIQLAGDASSAMQPVTLQQLGDAGLVPEAPQDGVYYARRNATWQAAAARNVDDFLIGMIAARPSGAGDVSWPELSGQALNKVTYARLWAWAQAKGLFATSLANWNANNFGKFLDQGTTFRVPFIAGAFIRSIDTSGSWFDPGRASGTVQTAALLPHAHTTTGTTGPDNQDHSHPYNGDPTAPGISGYVSGGGIGAGNTAGRNTQHDHNLNLVSNTVGGPENRPANIAYRHFIYAGNPIA